MFLFWQLVLKSINERMVNFLLQRALWMSQIYPPQKKKDETHLTFLTEKPFPELCIAYLLKKQHVDMWVQTRCYTNKTMHNKRDDRPADHFNNPWILIAGALQSFPPRGHIIEEVLHLQTGASRSLVEGFSALISGCKRQSSANSQESVFPGCQRMAWEGLLVCHRCSQLCTAG